MEMLVRATFARSDDMWKAAEALKRQEVIDLRIAGTTGSPLPDDVEFAADLIEGTNRGYGDARRTLQVSVQKSRSRQAIDTLLACGAVIDICE